MTGFLIDTNVLSEYNRLGGPDAGVNLAEIQKGIDLPAEGKRRAQLELWLRQDLEAWFFGRVLPVDRQMAARWASLVAQGALAGRPLPTVDSLIAATALSYDDHRCSKYTGFRGHWRNHHQSVEGCMSEYLAAQSRLKP